MRLALTIWLLVVVMAAEIAPTPASPPLPLRKGKGASNYNAVRLVKRQSQCVIGPSPILMGAGVAKPGWGLLTSYPRMTAELQDEARRSRWIRLTALGRTREGRTLWMARAADPAAPPPARTVRLLVLCRQHGDEPASTEAVLGLLRRIAGGGDPPLRAALRRATLYVVPMVNPDGATAGTRENGAGADLNRDWGTFSQPETRAVAHAVALVRPHVIIDAHNWDGGDHYNANCVEVTRDAAAPLAQSAQGLQAAGVAQLEMSGYAVAATSYGPSADPHLAHRWFTQQGILSCLIETHSGDPRDTADFQRRQGVYVALIHALARHYAPVRAQLDALEGYEPASVREALLFPTKEVASSPDEASPKESSHYWGGGASSGKYLWLWAVCPYGLALFAFKLTRDGGSATAPTPASVRAIGRPSRGHLGMRRCQCSPYSRAPRPAPAACGRKR